jgi:zinc transport system substrate-binding protein
VDPTNRAAYQGRYTEFTNELAEIHKELAAIFAGKQGLEFIVFHPSWGYFAHTYGLKQVAIEIEGKAPKPAQLAKLIGHCREHSIKVVFVQPQFSAKSAELVAREIDGQVIIVDPLAENWSDNLRMVAKKFQTAL